MQGFKDETLWNYEVGVKSSFQTVTLNGSLFYADIDNLGVNVDAGACSSRVVINVPEAHTMGGELELAVHPTDALLVTFAGSYVEAEFDSTVRTATDILADDDNVKTPAGSVINGIKDGNRIPSVPNWQLSAVATYTFPGLFQSRESYVTASWQFVGESDHPVRRPGATCRKLCASSCFICRSGWHGQNDSDDFRDRMELDAYNLFNLNAGMVYDSWEVMFYIKNIARRKPATLLRP